MQLSSCDEFMVKVNSLVSKVRHWHIKETSSSKLLTTVAHDVWDGKRKQFIRLTLFFIDKETLFICNIPITLAPPMGKTSILPCKTYLASLEECDTHFVDISKSANYNYTAAAKVGRLQVLFVYFLLLNLECFSH